MPFLRVVLWTFALLALAVPATAQDADEIAQTLADQGYYVARGAAIDETALSEAVAEARRTGERLNAVVLDSTPPGGATAFADALLDRLGAGTVLVVTPAEIGYTSYEYDSGDLDRAADQSIDAFRRDAVAGVAAFADALSGSSSGGAGVLVVLGLVALGVLVFLLVRGRRKRQLAEQAQARRLAEARREIRAQIDAMTDGILELSDRVTIAGPKVQQHFGAASQGYQAALQAVDGAATPAELERIADDLDEARWELEAARALLDGRPVPERSSDEPAPSACFFDPTHGAGTEVEEVRTPAGARPVRVCAACDAMLDRDAQPPTRTIPVDGIPTPAAQAPRGYGGGGMDVDDFSVRTRRGHEVPVAWGPPRYQASGCSGAGAAGGGWSSGGWSTGGWSGAQSGGRRRTTSFGGRSRSSGGSSRPRGRGGRRL